MASPFSGTPVADDLDLTTTTDAPVDFQLTGTCAGTMHFTIITAPTEGTFGHFDEDTGEGEYIPGSGFEGTDSFTFAIDDGTDVSAEATVTVEVLAASAAGTPSTPPAPTPSTPPPAPPSTIPPPPPAPTTGGTLPGMGPAIAGAAAVAAGTAAAAPAGGATPPPMPPATPAPGTATPAPAGVAPAPGAPVVPPTPPAPTTGGTATPTTPTTTTPWYKDPKRLAVIAALLALLALLLWLAFGGNCGGGGAPGPVPTPPPPTASSSGPTPPPPPPPVVSGVNCPTGYTKVPLASNSCQLLGWDGEEMPYEAVSNPQPGRLVVGKNPLPHKNVVTGFTPIAGEDLAICWPSAIPFGAEVAANSVMWAVYGQHANRVTQPGWYTSNCDWQTRCGLRLKDPSCVRYNTDGTADFTTCNMVVPVPIP